MDLNTRTNRLPLAPRAKYALESAAYSTLGEIKTAIDNGKDLTTIAGVGAPTVKTIKSLIAGKEPERKKPLGRDAAVVEAYGNPAPPEPKKPASLLGDPRVVELARDILIELVRHTGKAGTGHVQDAWGRALEFYNNDIQPKQQQLAREVPVSPRFDVSGPTVPNGVPGPPKEKVYGNPVLQAAYERGQLKGDAGLSDQELRELSK